MTNYISLERSKGAFTPDANEVLRANGGSCSSSDVITSGGRKSETTMEDKLILVVCGYPELYDTTSYFYKNRNKFCNETGAACRSPPPHDANSRLLCCEFHARMKRISRANVASKLKMFKRPTTCE